MGFSPFYRPWLLSFTDKMSLESFCLVFIYEQAGTSTSHPPVCQTEISGTNAEYRCPLQFKNSRNTQYTAVLDKLNLGCQPYPVQIFAFVCPALSLLLKYNNKSTENMFRTCFQNFTKLQT